MKASSVSVMFSLPTATPERELTVPNACPAVYETLAADLSKHLGSAEDPPLVAVPGGLEDFHRMRWSARHQVMRLRSVLLSRTRWCSFCRR